MEVPTEWILTPWRVVIIILGYLLTLLTSGYVIQFFISFPKQNPSSNKTSKSRIRYPLSHVIGKCENILTLTLILAGAYTGLALVFTAKSIVRYDLIKVDPTYFLGGTIINFTFSVIMGFLIRIALTIPGV